MRTLPWVREMKGRHGRKGLAVVGVHTPEFDHEREASAVAREVARHRLDYPHLLDNDFAYWRALGNEYWPTNYLVDRCGRIRFQHIGEVHEDRQSGRQLEARIVELLAERPGQCAAAP